MIGPLPSQRCTWTPATPTNPAGRRHYRHRHAEFLVFLKLVAKAYPRRQLHVVLDNYGTHTHLTAKAGLAKHPARPPALHPDFGELDEPGRGVRLHHHPPGDPAGQLRQRRGPGRCHPPLRRWPDQRCQPFLWVKTPTTA